MNEMIVNNVTLPIIEWNGERVLTFRDIDRVHDRVDGTARGKFYSNKKRFSEGTDFYKVPKKELINELCTFDAHKNMHKGNPNLSMILITQSGYLMIVKALDDDVAWEVQRKLSDSYFMLKNIIEEKKQEVSKTKELDEFINTQKQLLEMELERNETFRDTMLKSFQQMVQLVVTQSEMIAKQNESINMLLNNRPTNNTLPVSEPVSLPIAEIPETLPTVANKKERKPSKLFSSEYFLWKRNIENLTIGFDRNEIFKRTYKYMQKHYGICWDQENKDYANLYGKRAKSTLELIYFMEKDNFVLKELFSSSLDSVCKLNDKLRTPVTFPVHNVREMEVLGEYIIKESKNNSPHGSSFWRQFFAEDSNILSEYEERYRKDLSAKGRISKLDLIRHYEALENIFVIKFNKWVKATYPEIIGGVK